MAGREAVEAAVSSDPLFSAASAFEPVAVSVFSASVISEPEFSVSFSAGFLSAAGSLYQPSAFFRLQRYSKHRRSFYLLHFLRGGRCHQSNTMLPDLPGHLFLLLKDPSGLSAAVFPKVIVIAVYLDGTGFHDAVFVK